MESTVPSSTLPPHQYHSSMSPLLFIPLLALACSVIGYAATLKIFPRLGLVDFPNRYGLSRTPIPYPAGIVAVVVFLIFFGIVEPTTEKKIGVIIGIILLTIFSFIDDRRPLPSWIRLLVHIAIACLIFATGTRIYSLTNPLAGSLQVGGHFILNDIFQLDTIKILVPHFGLLPVASGLFTLLWLGMTINALNWFDGISGQVSLLSTIGFFTIGFLSLSDRVNEPSLALLAFLLGALAFGSLMFDFPPPKLLLGDTGAMFFGLMLGVLTIYSGGKVATMFLVLGVPLIDSVLVVIRRLLKGKSIFQGNTRDEHLHHRLLQKGWTPRQVLCLTAALGASFGIIALFLDTLSKFLAAVLLFLIMLLLSQYSRPRPQESIDPRPH